MMDTADFYAGRMGYDVAGLQRKASEPRVLLDDLISQLGPLGPTFPIGELLTRLLAIKAEILRMEADTFTQADKDRAAAACNRAWRTGP